MEPLKELVDFHAESVLNAVNALKTRVD
jgi:hypothetical protein